MPANNPRTSSTGRNRDGGRRPIPVPPVPRLSRHDEEEAAEPDDDEPELELTLRAVLGGIMVGGILCFSNMYFGLQTGWVTMVRTYGRTSYNRVSDKCNDIVCWCVRIVTCFRACILYYVLLAITADGTYFLKSLIYIYIIYIYIYTYIHNPAVLS